MQRIALAAFPLLLATAGCGGSDTAPATSGDFYTASSIEACLEAAAVTVRENDPGWVDGDASGGTFHVEVGGAYATVAFAASEASAARTERLVQRELESPGGAVDLAHHRGNVVYWQLDESDAPVRAVEACLDSTPTDRSLGAQM